MNSPTIATDLRTIADTLQAHVDTDTTPLAHAELASLAATLDSIADRVARLETQRAAPMLTVIHGGIDTERTREPQKSRI